MKTQALSVDLLKIDGGTQSRLSIHEDTVEDYAELIAATPPTEWPFPPLDVFHDGSDYFVADGFHRCLGAQRAERGSIPCVVHKGTATDARIFGMTANDKHGLRMSRADKRANVEWLLDNGGKMTQAAIAQSAGVTTRTVKMIVADRNPVSIAGKSPPKQDSKGKISPSTPSRGDSDPFEDLDSDPFEDAPPQTAATESAPDYGKCPNCAGTQWSEDEDGVACAKCRHPHGEPAGDVDEDRVNTQRQKTVKTAEALLRAFDDLHMLLPKSQQHEVAIKSVKTLLATAKAWK